METAQRLADTFSGPVIFDYVWWVLTRAREKGIDKLYFLARDGLTLMHVAQILCERFELGIECRYLYCSRTALRMPTYFFIGDEAMDLLLLEGYYSTPKSVLLRAGLDSEEREAVYAQTGTDAAAEEAPLTHAAFCEYAARVRESEAFRACVRAKSSDAYAGAVGYLRAQGLFDGETVAIVDSGWTGSMQRSLRQLLEFAGYKGHVVGFYFGMYAPPKAAADGDYLTWLFDARSGIGVKASFCNNLFECLLAAPHGMTAGYRETDGRFEPVLLPPPQGEERARIELQARLILDYARKRAEKIDFKAFHAAALRRDTARRIRRYMLCPTQEEAAYYGRFLFCDDVTEAYRLSLASEEQRALLRECTLLGRVRRKLKLAPTGKKIRAQLFWPYGTAAFEPAASRMRYRANIWVKECLRFLLQRPRKGARRAKDEGIERKAEDCEVVSFDIFDTLLFRTVNRPTDVFLLMEKEAEALGVKDFHDRRIEAERAARRAAGTGDREVTLEAIYAAMQIGEQEAQKLMALEEETELRVLRRDEKMADLLERCASKGKRVLIISDMYHTSPFLERALHQAGIDAYDRLYVSCEEEASKASGALFQRVAREEEIANVKNWLHVGDNAYSDGTVPRTLGLRTCLYDNGRAEGPRPNRLCRTIRQGKAYAHLRGQAFLHGRQKGESR